MTKESRPVDIREVYGLMDDLKTDLTDLVGDMKKDITASVLRIEDRFNVLEAGRLTALEGKYADLVSRHYLLKEQVSPLKKIVYGTTGAILLGVIGAVLTLVIRNSP